MAYLDGKPVARFDRTPLFDQHAINRTPKTQAIVGGIYRKLFEIPPSFRPAPDGTLAVLGPAGGASKRFKATPAADMDLTKLVGNVEAERKKAEEEAAAAAAKAKADKEAEIAKKKADHEAAQAKRKAEAEAAAAARAKARQEAMDAQKLKVLNAQRARQGLPPLNELPKSP